MQGLIILTLFTYTFVHRKHLFFITNYLIFFVWIKWNLFWNNRWLIFWKNLVLTEFLISAPSQILWNRTPLLIIWYLTFILSCFSSFLNGFFEFFTTLFRFISFLGHLQNWLILVYRWLRLLLFNKLRYFRHCCRSINYLIGLLFQIFWWTKGLLTRIRYLNLLYWI